MAKVLVDDVNYGFGVPKVEDIADTGNEIPFVVTAEMTANWDGMSNPSATVQQAFAKLSAGIPVTLIGKFTDPTQTLVIQTRASTATKYGNASPTIKFDDRKVGSFIYSYTMKEVNGQTVVEVTSEQE